MSGVCGYIGLLFGASGAPAVPGPVVLSLTQSNNNTGVLNNIPIAMPATVAAGDLLLMAVMKEGAGAGTTPAGWTFLNGSNTSLSANFSLYYINAAGTEGGTTVNITSVGTLPFTAHVFRIQAGTWSSTPQANNATGNSVNPDPPNVTAAWGAYDNLWLALAGIELGNNTVSVYPLAVGQTITANTTGSAANNSLASCRETNALATLNPGTYTLGSSGRWVAMTVVVKGI